jgi:rod shape-determining protein MreD
MGDIRPLRLWIYRGGFVAIGFALVLWSIVPFDMTAGTLPAPDIFYCITMLYVVRRPVFVPVWSIFCVFFLRDILTQAPLGLFTLLIVLGSEIVRTNIQVFREYLFALEWLWVAIIFACIAIIQQILMFLTLSQTPRIVDQLYLIVFTVATYPVIVGAVKYGFGITRPRPGESDAWGKRL